MFARITSLSLLILLSSACSKKTDEDNQGQGDANPDTEATPNGTTPSTGGTPNGTTPGEEETQSYTLTIGTVQLRAGFNTQTVEVTLTKGNEPEAEQSISGKLTCQEESKAEGTTDAEGKVTLSFDLKPSASETCDVRVDFGEDVIYSREKKDIQVAALRDLLQVANNGKFDFKNTAPQSYTIKTENCGDNAGMVKWTHDHVVTPTTEITNISDIYLYGNIANCRFFVNDEEVAKPVYNKIYIKYLGITRTSGQGRLELIHGYVWAGGTNIVLVVHASNGNMKFTETTLQLSNDDNRKAISAGAPSLGDIAWIKHNTGLLRWVVSKDGRSSRGW